MDISTLLNSIRDTHQWFAGQAARQTDTSLTLGNRIIGMYLVEYEIVKTQAEAAPRKYL